MTKAELSEQRSQIELEIAREVASIAFLDEKIKNFKT